MPASRATVLVSMSRVMRTWSKYGWLAILGSAVLKVAGLRTMFLRACSLGTYMRVSCGMVSSEKLVPRPAAWLRRIAFCTLPSPQL